MHARNERDHSPEDSVSSRASRCAEAAADPEARTPVAAPSVWELLEPSAERWTTRSPPRYPRLSTSTRALHPGNEVPGFDPLKMEEPRGVKKSFPLPWNISFISFINYATDTIYPEETSRFGYILQGNKFHHSFLPFLLFSNNDGFSSRVIILKLKVKNSRFFFYIPVLLERPNLAEMARQEGEGYRQMFHPGNKTSLREIYTV